MVTGSATKEKCHLQIARKSYDTFCCSPVIYGSVVRFRAMEMSTADLQGLFKVFNLSVHAREIETKFFVDFSDDMPIEKFSRFGFPPEAAYT